MTIMRGGDAEAGSLSMFHMRCLSQKLMYSRLSPKLVALLRDSWLMKVLMSLVC